MALKQALEEVKSKYSGGNIVEYIDKNRAELVKKHDLSNIDVSRLYNQARRGVNMGEIVPIKEAPKVAAKVAPKEAAKKKVAPKAKATKKPAAKKKTAKKK